MDEPLLLTIDRLPDPPVADAALRFVLRFPVVPRTNYALERSADLANWAHLTTVMSFTDSVEYFDEADSASVSRFYACGPRFSTQANYRASISVSMKPLKPASLVLTVLLPVDSSRSTPRARPSLTRAGCATTASRPWVCLICASPFTTPPPTGTGRFIRHDGGRSGHQRTVLRHVGTSA